MCTHCSRVYCDACADAGGAACTRGYAECAARGVVGDASRVAPELFELASSVDAARPALGRGPPMIQAELTQYYAGLATA